MWTIYLYDPSLWVGGWSTMTLLQDGRVLIAGGAYEHIFNTALLFVAGTTYKAVVGPPINADGTSSFKVSRGVIPLRFSLTENDVATCAMPPAVISLTRTSGGNAGSVNEADYSMAADAGSNFRIDSAACKYIYNLSRSIGVGVYRADISINGAVIGNAVFALK
jgi:hypothetical protein